MPLAAKKKTGGSQKEAGGASSPLHELKEALKKVSPELLKEAEKRVGELLKGDLSWTELFNLPPEKLKKMAEIGFEQFKSGAYDKAEKVLKGLTVIDPDNYYYHQVLGAAYQRQNKFPEAILEYSVACDLKKDDFVSLANRGECYLKLGLYPLAVQDFDRVIAEDPKGEDKWANRARMLKEQIQMMEKDKKEKK